MTKNDTTAYALPKRVQAALSRVDRLADGAAVQGTIWTDLSSIAKVDSVGIALTTQHLATRPVILPSGESVKGVVAFSRALGMSSHGTVSHWVTALGWLQDSGTPVNATTHGYAVTAYNGGKSHRAVIADALSVIKAMETDDARVARWQELANGAAAARIADEAERKRQREAADDNSNDVEKREAQVNDGTVTQVTADEWIEALRSLANVVAADPESAPFALSNGQAADVAGLLAVIGAATVGDAAVYLS